MTMRRSYLLLGVLLWLSGCNAADPASGPEPDSKTAIDADQPFRTDRASYHARPYADGSLAGVEIVIPMAYANATLDTVYFVGCRRPPAPALQKQVEGKWVTAWRGVELDCLSPAWDVAPGATFRDTLRVIGFDEGQNVHPVFATDVPGRYRLVRAVHADPDPLSPLVSEDLRISNEFDVEWAADE